MDDTQERITIQVVLTNILKSRFEHGQDFQGIEFGIYPATNKDKMDEWLRTALGETYAGYTPLDPFVFGNGSPVSRVEVKVHDPKNPADIQKAIDAIRRFFGEVKNKTFTIEPRLSGCVEQYMDIIPRPGQGVTKNQCAEMAKFVTLHSSYLFPQGFEYHPRIYKNGWEAYTGEQDLTERFMDGWNFAVGNQDKGRKGRVQTTPISAHIYVKTEDQGISLRESPRYRRFGVDYLVRIEYRLQNGAFPFTQPEQLNGFDWQQWNKTNGFFNFRTLDHSHMSAFWQRTFEKYSHITPMMCLANTHPRNKRRKFLHHTDDIEALNRKVRAAIKRFNQEWARVPTCEKPTISDTPLPGADTPITTPEESPVDTLESPGITMNADGSRNTLDFPVEIELPGLTLLTISLNKGSNPNKGDGKGSDSDPSFLPSSPVTSSYPSSDTRESMGSVSDPCLSRPLSSLSLSVSSSSSRVSLPRLGLKGSDSDPFPIGGLITSTGTTRGALATRARASGSSRNSSILKNYPSKPYSFRIQRRGASSLFVVSNLANLSRLDKLHAAKVIQLYSSQPP